MKKGDYVRTRNGTLGEIIFRKDRYVIIRTLHIFEHKLIIAYENDILKASNKIIDLIDEDDFVNAKRVVDIIYKEDNIQNNREYLITYPSDKKIRNKDIKSVITSEELEQIENIII